MFRNRIRRSKEIQTELNITAFMNLMVVLVPFLLITAVFSQVAILKMNLPGGKNPDENIKKPPMQLEVIIRAKKLVLSERNSGVISEFSLVDPIPLSSLKITDDVQNTGLDRLSSTTIDEKMLTAYQALNLKLQQLKARVSDATTISILAEPDTEYDQIIQTMDAVRLIDPNPGSDDLPGELFPDVSIGSAPEMTVTTDQQLPAKGVAP